MEYKNIWDKVLNSNEEVKYEFTIGKKYRKDSMVGQVIVGLLFIFIFAPLGVIIIATSLFYFGFYLKKANAYAFTDDRVLVHRGWLSTKLISTEYQKITDVIVVEPFLERVLLKTGSLKINTAGTGLEEIILKSVEKPYDIKKKLDELRKGR